MMSHGTLTTERIGAPRRTCGAASLAASLSATPSHRGEKSEAGAGRRGGGCWRGHDDVTTGGVTGVVTVERGKWHRRAVERSRATGGGVVVTRRLRGRSDVLARGRPRIERAKHRHAVDQSRPSASRGVEVRRSRGPAEAVDPPSLARAVQGLHLTVARGGHKRTNGRWRFSVGQWLVHKGRLERGGCGVGGGVVLLGVVTP